MLTGRRYTLKGFTLVEMLVVLVVLGMLAGLIGPRVLGYLDSARADTARIQILQFKAALKLYSIDVGGPPNANQGLNALVQAPEGVDNWFGPYLEVDDIPPDPWGRNYEYDVNLQTKRFKITSLGADGAIGGTGDNADVSN